MAWEMAQMAWEMEMAWEIVEMAWEVAEMGRDTVGMRSQAEMALEMGDQLEMASQVEMGWGQVGMVRGRRRVAVAGR